MSPITSSSVSSVPVTPPTSATNTVAGAAELQKQQQQLRQEVREKVKPIAEQVFISKQAQQQFDTYVASAANAADRYNTGNSSSSSSSATGLSTEQVLDSVKTAEKVSKNIYPANNCLGFVILFFVNSKVKKITYTSIVFWSRLFFTVYLYFI